MLTEVTIIDDGSDIDAQIQAAIDDAVSQMIDDALNPIRIPEAMQKIGDMAAGEIGQLFLDSQGPDGTAWPPLKRKRPAGRNQGSRPLIDTGELMQSVIADGADHIEDVGDDSLTFGTKNWKAGIHQHGTDRIPARPFMGITETIADQAVEIVADELFKQIGA